MNLELVISLLTEVFYDVLLILLPILGVGLVIGVIISIFQAATSIQEMTLTFVPKIVITIIAVVVMMPFIADKLISMTHKVFNLIVTVLQ
ncbi:MAG: flagellar type III secretion system protein FliQ [Ignavibacteria bacterium]|nr:flagellar type III secretion system protein FliQ [Ignavibacteria bacterium]